MHGSTKFARRLTTCFIALFLGLTLLLGSSAQSQSVGRFDKLSDSDRKELAKKFTQEVWPLLQRRGKDGCVGCHNAKHSTGLRFSGKPEKDFAMLVGKGFLIPDDLGSILELVRTSNRKIKMPPGNRPAWTENEIRILEKFVKAVEQRQARN